MIHMIHSRKSSVREMINKLPALFVDNFRANENVVIDLLTYFKQEIQSVLSHKNLRNENILHVLIDKGFMHALNRAIDHYDVFLV